MEFTSSFFDQAPSPMLVYSFDPGTDEGSTSFRCEHRNPATERWICENADGRVECTSVDDVFEYWGILDEFHKILNSAHRDGRCFSSLFAHKRQAFAVLDAFRIDVRHLGLSIRGNNDVQRAFPLDLFLSVSLDILCVVDEEGRFVRVNPEFSKLLGYDIADIEGIKIGDFVHPEDLPSTIEAMRTLHEGEALPYFINRYRTKSGEYRYLQWRSIPYPPYIIGSARDITEAFSLSVSLEKEFTCDPLTGACNRKFFEHEANRLLLDHTGRGVVSTMIMVDIDHFKHVNDRYGHPVGDLVLSALVKILSENCRASDSVARVGGEEFVVLLPNTRMAGAYTVAEKMREAVMAHTFEGVGHITASFGVSEILAEDDLQRWYTRADTALYLAKNNGRNRTVTADMLYRADERIEIIKWQSDFDSGNKMIDREHKALILAGEKLLEAYYRHDVEDEAKRLQKLFSLLTDHFASEERILHEAGYLDLPAHREIHKALMASAAFWRTLQKQGRIQSPAFYGFLINKVIGDHLLQDDAKYFPMFRNKK